MVPANNGGRHGVVDEKHSHEQRDQTHRREVQLETPEHLVHFFGPLRRRGHARVFGQNFTERCDRALTLRRLGEFQLDDAEFSAPAK